MAAAASHSPSQVVTLLGALVDHLLPTSSDQSRSGMRKYCMRILGSRIAPSGVRADFEVSSKIKRLLAGSRRPGDMDGVEAALRYDELFRRLSGQRHIRDKWSVYVYVWWLIVSQTARGLRVAAEVLFV